MKRNQITAQINSKALCLGLMTALFLPVAPARAQTQPDNKAIGEISAARQASVNGLAARTSGTTIFSNSQIKTAESGSATISLGKRGRLELGGKTDLTLQYANSVLGGTLRAGRLVLSVPAGVSLALNTANGLVKADGLRPTVLSIAAGAEKMKVVAHLGEAQLVAAGKTETVTAGEEVVIGSQTRGAAFHHRRLVAAGLVGTGSAVGIAAAGQTAAGQTLGPVIASAKPTFSLTGLINTGINFSLAQIIGGSGRDPESYFDTNVVCRDQNSFQCRPRSPNTP